MIYLITVNYFSANLIADLLASIQADAIANYTLIIVNNSPQDDSIANLAQDTVLLLEAGKNLGFGAACNLGLNWVYARSPQSIVWLINPDAGIIPGSLKAVSNLFVTHPTAAIVGTIVQQPDGQLWFGGGQFNAATGAIVSEDLFANSEATYLNCDWVTGCSLLLNLALFSTCPQFDPAYFLYYEDFDFCQRYARQGYPIAITREIAVIHAPSSIADRAPAFKLQCSTFSYLLTLERYTRRSVLLLRLLRIVLYSFGLLLVKPQAAIGKWMGILLYLRRSGDFE